MLVQWWRELRGTGGEVAATLLWFGALSAAGAAARGWLHAYDAVYFGDDLKLLLWLGTATAFAALAVLGFRKKLRAKPLAIALTLCAALVTAAGHFGASLTHGADFLRKF